jgi:hypothetical protein
MDEQEKTVQLITPVPASLRQRIKLLAAKRGVTMQSIQLAALEEKVSAGEQEALNNSLSVKEG